MPPAAKPLLPHPDSGRLDAAVRECVALAVSWEGDAFRFTDLTYANLRDLVTGEGSRKAGARYTPKGAFRTLYFAVDPETALAEVLHHHRSQAVPDAQATPVTLFACRVDVERLLDLTDRRVRRLLGVSLGQLKESWRPQQHAGQEALTQAIGRLVREHGFQGLLAPSARRRVGKNLALFPERLAASELSIYHPEAFPVFRRRARRR